MDRYRQEARRLIAAGADPRRADRAAAERFGVPRAMGARGVLALGIVLGGFVVVVIGLAVAMVFDLRPAPSADIALAAIVHTAIPDTQALAPDDLRTRLQVPPDISVRLAPLFADLPSAPTSNDEAATLASDAAHQHRIVAMRAIAIFLGSLPPDERGSTLIELSNVAEEFRNPTARKVLRALVALPQQDRTRLANNQLLPRVLTEVAALDEVQAQALLTAGLSTLTDNPERVALLNALPQLDLSAVSLLLRWTHADESQRSALLYVMAELANNDPGFGRMLAAFFVGNPGLYAAIASLPRYCAFQNARACR